MQDSPMRTFRLQLTYLAIIALVVLLQTLPLQGLHIPLPQLMCRSSSPLLGSCGAPI